MGLPAKVNP